jgi:hypothetical protein
MMEAKATLVRCPICKAEAAEIDRGLFDGIGFDCKFHGRFRVSNTALAQAKSAATPRPEQCRGGKKRTRRQWEHALMLAKARASESRPLISSDLV